MDENKRRIRSFVMRAGRMTEGQQKGWNTGWPLFGLSEQDGRLDWDAQFSQRGPKVVEIGFGMGDSLLEMAQAAPDTRFVGIEVHKPGVGRLLSRVLELGIDNLKVYAEDAVPILEHCIESESIDQLQIYFPDPWHKKRHNKRRLIQADFVALISSRLRPEGLVHLATDWQPYAEHMLEVLSAQPALVNTAGAAQYTERPSWRPETKFERRGARLGHGVWDLLFRRVSL